jgi:hypothetical protein
MRTILQYVVNSGKNAVSNFEIPAEQIVSEEELGKHNFDEIILNRFKPYIGKNYQVIAKENLVEPGEQIIVTAGTPGVAGTTSYLELITVK